MLAAAREQLGELHIAAARNCHRAFLNGCILLDLDTVWIYPEKPSENLCATSVTAEDVRRVFAEHPELNAVYLTSPDYLGNMAEIRGIASVCREKGALLLADNAHGAYLRFAGEGLHPLELGADLCCDSAHKTLPALTGTSLLHVSRSAPEGLAGRVKAAMSLFASTSPSYVLLSSLDRLTSELAGELPRRIIECCGRVAEVKGELAAMGFELSGSEPMKLTLAAPGYTGDELASQLRSRGIEPEYSDEGCVVLMPSPYNSGEDFERLVSSLRELPKREGGRLPRPELPSAQKAMTLREAYFAPFERIPVDKAAGRVCARSAMSCTPSVPVIVGGEVFDEKLINFLKRYSFFEADVVK